MFGMRGFLFVNEALVSETPEGFFLLREYRFVVPARKLLLFRAFVKVFRLNQCDSLQTSPTILRSSLGKDLESNASRRAVPGRFVLSLVCNVTNTGAPQ